MAPQARPPNPCHCLQPFSLRARQPWAEKQAEVVVLTDEQKEFMDQVWRGGGGGGVVGEVGGVVVLQVPCFRARAGWLWGSGGCWLLAGCGNPRLASACSPHAPAPRCHRPGPPHAPAPPCPSAPAGECGACREEGRGCGGRGQGGAHGVPRQGAAGLPGWVLRCDVPRCAVLGAPFEERGGCCCMGRGRSLQRNHPA